MRHALLLIVLAVIGYAGWQMTDPIARQDIRRHVTRHGSAIGAIVLLVLLLLLAAASVSSISIL
jgi:hypothetical protein